MNDDVILLYDVAILCDRKLKMRYSISCAPMGQVIRD
jgi:hypothetical protein